MARKKSSWNSYFDLMVYGSMDTLRLQIYGMRVDTGRVSGISARRKKHIICVYKSKDGHDEHILLPRFLHTIFGAVRSIVSFSR